MTIKETTATSGSAKTGWDGAQWFVNGEVLPPGAPLRLPRGATNKVKLIAPGMKGKDVNLIGVEADHLEIQAAPIFNSWVTLDAAKGAAEWTFTQTNSISGYLNLVVISREVVINLEEKCWVMSDDLADEVEVLIDGKEVPAEGVAFYVGFLRAITLKLKDGSPIEGLGVRLKWEIIEGEDLKIASVPGFDLEQSVYEWDVTGTVGDGKFQLSFEGDGVAHKLDVPTCTLAPIPQGDLMRIEFDGDPVRSGDTIYVPQYSTHTLKLFQNGAGIDKVWAGQPHYAMPTTPGAGVPQVVHPTEGATWRLENTGFGIRSSVGFFYGEENSWKPLVHLIFKREVETSDKHHADPLDEEGQYDPRR